MKLRPLAPPLSGVVATDGWTALRQVAKCPQVRCMKSWEPAGILQSSVMAVAVCAFNLCHRASEGAHGVMAVWGCIDLSW